MTNIDPDASDPGQVTVSFVDDPHSPVVFADGVSGIAYMNGVIRLTFEVGRVNHITSPGPVSRVVVGTLVMPLSGAQGLRNLLQDYLLQIEKGSTSQMRGTNTLQ